VCGGYQLLGRSYQLGDELLPGVGLVDLETVRADGPRLIGNVAIEVELEPGQRRVLAGFDRPSPAAEAAAADGPSASLQGDLEVFGLPALLQSLGDSSASGVLTLRGPKGGDVFASMTLRDGKLEEIRNGRLRGADAFYQLLERPIPGQFTFVKGSTPAKPGAAALAILPLTLEAMRRYDELQEAAALVPDTAVLEPTATKPTPHASEKDGSFLQALWERANLGGTPLDLEAAIAADSYRIRRMLVHWVEQGSLVAG